MCGEGVTKMRTKTRVLLSLVSAVSVLSISTVGLGGAASAQASKHGKPRERALVGVDHIEGVVDSFEVLLTGSGRFRHFGHTTSVLHSTLPDGSDQTVDVTTRRGTIHQVPAGDLDAAGVSCPAGQLPGKAKYDIRGGTGDFEEATGSVEVTTCALVEPLAIGVRIIIDVRVAGTIYYEGD
jgi:hypothetical protein